QRMFESGSVEPVVRAVNLRTTSLRSINTLTKNLRLLVIRENPARERAVKKPRNLFAATLQLEVADEHRVEPRLVEYAPFFQSDEGGLHCWPTHTSSAQRRQVPPR